ncbi:MAG: 50S ribosomal protein L6 [Candidatus ainarchaeum sp.]|nr:50S ribosomal protein L6 [Candidatus ainarchaeum sp.]
MESNIKVPDNVEVKYDGKNFVVKGPKGSVSKKNPVRLVDLTINGKDITFKTKNEKKPARAQMMTLSKNIKNMISGVCRPYNYKLSIVYSHFPLSVAVKDNVFVISNFAGQKKQIKIKLVDNVKVEIKGKDIFIISVDKDAAGQVAANIEGKAKVRSKDRRIFQDGIYIVEKGVQNE